MEVLLPTELLHLVYSLFYYRDAVEDDDDDDLQTIFIQC